jgi:8-oxo-dGTP pyrophosphatase MutT (NUDIX family)
LPSPFIAPPRTQLAALCWRRAADGGREVLLVTSSRGRWILPKGWPIPGRPPARAALAEAWEEAGVARGKVARQPLGSFLGTKITPSGDEIPCLTRVFAVKVVRTSDDFPEAARRDRRWLSPERAAELVTEDGLRDLLIRFARS